MTDLFGDEPGTQGDGARAGDGPGRDTQVLPPRKPNERRPQNRRRSWASFLVMVVILGGLTYLAARVIPPLFDTADAPTASITDFPGPGQGEIVVEIPDGATGIQIGQILQAAGIVATVDAFTTAHSANANATSIQPGAYNLPQEMKASDAVQALLDPNRRADTRITIPEGWRSDQIYQRIADSLGVPLADVEAAAHDYAALGLEGPPNTNPASLDPMEGWFYPETYTVAPGQGAPDVLKQMYDRTIAELDAQGVPAEDRLRVLTIGSIAMREVNQVADYGKVSRVIENRLLPENLGQHPWLGMDSTLRYSWDRQNPGVQLDPNLHNTSDDPYNTRRFPGLPPSPIGAVDAAAMSGAMYPEEGPWVWFVTLDLCTGVTEFTDDQATFNSLRATFQEWYAEWTANGQQC